MDFLWFSVVSVFRAARAAPKIAMNNMTSSAIFTILQRLQPNVKKAEERKKTKTPILKWKNQKTKHKATQSILLVLPVLLVLLP